MTDIIFLDLPERISAPPTASLSLISYIKEKGFSADYFNLSFKIIKFLEDKRNLVHVLNDIKSRLNNQHKLTLKERRAFNFLINILESNIIKTKTTSRNAPYQVSDMRTQTYLWYLYSVAFQNKRQQFKWCDFKYSTNISWFSVIKLQNRLSLLCSNNISKIVRRSILKNLFLGDRLLRDIKNTKFIAFSINYRYQYKIVTEIAKVIKSEYPKKKIIVGGGSVLFNFNVKNIRKEHFKHIDFLVIGEGEVALYKLLESIKNGCSLKKVPNLIYFNKERIIITIQKPIKNLNILPYPNYKTYILKYGHSDFLPFDDSKEILYEISRGCYWRKCVFCSFCRLNVDEHYRVKNPKKVVEELKNIKAETGIDYFHIVCDELTINYAIRFSKIILEKGLKIKWKSYMRFENNLDLKTLKLMKKAGCYELRLGLESGNQKINDLIGKGVDIKIAERILKECKNTGISCVLHTIIGFPMESLFQALDTFKFINKNITNLKQININKFRITPYSYIHLHPKKFGITKIVSFEENKIKAKNYYIKQKVLNLIGYVYMAYILYKEYPQHFVHFRK